MWGLKLDSFLGDLRQLEQGYHLEPATVLQGKQARSLIWEEGKALQEA